MDTYMHPSMGKRISARRKELAMTQDQLAAALGVSPQAVSKWENDQSCPDIQILPELAKRLGMTTDALLGMEPEAEVVQPEDADETTHQEAPEETAQVKNRVEVRDRPGRCRMTAKMTAALWIVSVGAMMLGGHFLGREVGLWSAMWTLGLFWIGAAQLCCRETILGSGMAACGAYFAADRLGLFVWLHERGILPWELTWTITLPILLVLFGLCLLISSFRRRSHHGHLHPGHCFNRAGNETYMEDGYFEFRGSFGEERFTAVTPLLRGGNATASFGEFTIDLTQAEAVSDDCEITVNASFGETIVLVPKRFRVILTGTKSFGERVVTGEPDACPAGVIYLHCSTSFGETEIRYV